MELPEATKKMKRNRGDIFPPTNATHRDVQEFHYNRIVPLLAPPIANDRGISDEAEVIKAALRELDNALKEYENATYEVHVNNTEPTHIPTETVLKIVAGTPFHIPKDILNTLNKGSETIKGLASDYMVQEEKLPLIFLNVRFIF